MSLIKNVPQRLICIWRLSPWLVVLFEELVKLLEKRALLEVVCHWVWGLYSLTPFPVCFLGFLVMRYNQLASSSASPLPCFSHLMNHPSGNISQTATCHLYFTLGHQRNWQVMCISHLSKCVWVTVYFSKNTFKNYF